MIKLGTAPKEPLRLPLGAGASITYRPMTAIDREAALAASRRFFEEARAGLAAFSRYGVETKSEWAEDSDLTVGVASLVNLVEMALRVFVSWEGIGDAAGKPLPLTRENIAALLREPIYNTIVHEAITRPALEMDLEGNGSAPSPNGAREGAETIAQDAPRSAPHAPAESRAPTANAAPSANGP
jgi:hypothetical protein